MSACVLDSKIEKRLDEQMASILDFLLEADTISITCKCQTTS